ncbi:MAG: hypothetical protein AAGA10_09185 [Bacteroidota bacterium]
MNHIRLGCRITKASTPDLNLGTVNNSIMTPSREKKDLVVFWIILVLLTLLSPLRQFAQNSYHVNTRNGKTTVRVNNRMTKFTLEYEGDITVSDDDKDIVDISRGGYIEISKSAFGSKRRIVIESTGSGGLDKAYFVGSRKQAFEPEGKKWLAEVLPEVVRTTTFAATSRVDRFYRKGGVASVLDEIEELESDYVRRHYFDLLLDKGLSGQEVVQTIEAAGELMGSDHYLAEFLKGNQQDFLSNAQTTTAFLNAAKSLGSDHYMTEVLKRAIDDSDVSDAQLVQLFEVAEDIASDHYLSVLLKKVIDERRLSTQTVNELIRLTGEISSDHYKTEVLRRALSEEDLSESNYNAFIESLDDIASDHYSMQVINDLLEEDLDSESLSKILELVEENVSSDHYAHEIMKKVIQEQELTGKSLETFIEGLESINSDHYLMEVIKRFGANRSLTESQMLKILEATKNISSDHYHASTLVILAPRVRALGGRVVSAYREAAKSIGSDTYYGKALKALDR